MKSFSCNWIPWPPSIPVLLGVSNSPFAPKEPPSLQTHRPRLLATGGTSTMHSCSVVVGTCACAGTPQEFPNEGQVSLSQVERTNGPQRTDTSFLDRQVAFAFFQSLLLVFGVKCMEKSSNRRSRLGGFFAGKRDPKEAPHGRNLLGKGTSRLDILFRKCHAFRRSEPKRTMRGSERSLLAGPFAFDGNQNGRDATPQVSESSQVRVLGHLRLTHTTLRREPAKT